MPANMIGIKAKLYYNTATFGTPTWVHVTLVKDWTMNQKPNMAEVLDRSTKAVRKVPTTYDISCGGSLRVVPDSAIYLAFRTALLAGSVIDILCLTGLNTNNGEIGWRYEATVEDLTTDQGAANVMYDSIMLSPHGESSNVIQSVVVSAGAPVLTTFAA
jgi:hypothetical protein